MIFKRLISGACVFAIMAGMVGAPAFMRTDRPEFSITASAAGELRETDIHVDIYAVDYNNERSLLSSLDVYEKVTKKKSRFMFSTDKIIIDSTKIRDIEYDYTIPKLLSDKQVTFNGYLQYHFYNAEYDAARGGVGKDEVLKISPENKTAVYTWSRLFESDPHDYSLMTLSGQILNFTPAEYIPPATPLNNAEVRIPDAVYNSRAKTPSAAVTLDGKTLRKGIDYTIEYKNNINVGRASVTISGIGDYRGKRFSSFYILPGQVKAKKLTSKKKSVTFTWAKDAQTGGYTVQLALNKSFTKGLKEFSISKASTVSKKINGLKKGKTYYAHVRGFKKVASRRLEGSWSRVLKVKCK